MRRISLFCLVVTVMAFNAVAAMRLPSVISHNMVLQRDVNVPLWGWADPGEEIQVSFQGQKVSVKAGESGKWMLWLEPMAAGGPYNMVIGSRRKITLKNIMVGDVWLCSGQSNMAWPVKHSDAAEEELAQAVHPGIRLFAVTRGSSCQPLDDVPGNWLECGPDTVADFSAVAYFFGRELHRHLDVPVGLVNSSVGGTAIEYWMPLESFYSGDAELEKLVVEWQRKMIEHIARIEEDTAMLQEWRSSIKAISGAGVVPPMPLSPLTGDERQQAPARLYNAMISPLIPYAIKGAIWYQGEANVNNAMLYRKLLPAMIHGWRSAWHKGAGQQGAIGEFPFLIVQLANFLNSNDDPVTASGWAELREAQAMTAASVTNAALAVAIDIGDAGNIHPGNKLDVGRRLALAALRVAYREDLVASGPVFDRLEVKDGHAVAYFDNAGGGLVAKGGALKRFELAGRDGRFVWADAVIEGQAVKLSSAEIAEPVYARYAWSSNPEGCNLYNAEGLPAVPFRTGDPAMNVLPRETHVYTCVHTVTPPVIDGVLDDKVWSTAASAGPYKALESYKFSKFPTDARLAWDSENLYISVRCVEPDTTGLVAGATQHDGMVYEDDSVEMFLDVTGSYKTYFQYIVNSKGVIYDGTNRDDPSKWNGPCAVAVEVGKDEWIVEMAVPWKSFGVDAPGKGDRWGMQLTRTRAHGAYEISQWSPSYGPTNHKPSHFGTLLFD